MGVSPAAAGKTPGQSLSSSIARPNRAALQAIALLPLLWVPLVAQSRQIGIIDLYGRRSVSAEEVRRALQIAEGDSLPESPLPAQHRLENLPGVTAAHLELVCCEAGRVILYVGLQEKGAPSVRFHRAPRKPVYLSPDVVQAGNDFAQALTAAVEAGDLAEDQSQGHALMHFPAANAVQQRFITLATRDIRNLRDVLRHSAAADQRALAAQVLGYATTKRDVVGDLVFGMRDPDPAVRNNATRALWVIAELAQRAPQLRIRIPWGPFVGLLNSLDWTDRNKASLALMALSAGRDSELLKSLRKEALGALVEMARWKSPGHALAAFVLLGRVAGLAEDRIQAAWSRGDREAVIHAVQP